MPAGPDDDSQRSDTPRDGPPPSSASLLRQRGEEDSSKVDMVELFFDLIFVFAVTQLSHGLLEDLSLHNLLQMALLLAATWWVWIYTSWVTNWLDPTHTAVRWAVFAMMLAGLLLAASISGAFGEHEADRGWAFASAYVAVQVGRTLFILWALRGEAEHRRRNFQRVLVWLLVSGLLWLRGGWAEGDARLHWWMAALAVELVSPALYFWVPGLGRSRVTDWDLDGSHLAERCALFVIIALGESLLVTGATFAGQPWDLTSGAAMALSFCASVAMWWLYFAIGSERAHDRISASKTPGRLARAAYTYLHLPIVAGIIAGAVADELVLAHPEHADTPAVAAIVGGPALYLVGTMLFKWVTSPHALPPRSHLGGLAALALLLWPGLTHAFSALALMASTVVVLAGVALWEHAALRGFGRDATPSEG